MSDTNKLEAFEQIKGFLEHELSNASDPEDSESLLRWIAALSPQAQEQPEQGALGWKLGMRVMQSDLYKQLDDAERAECDALIRSNPTFPSPINQCIAAVTEGVDQIQTPCLAGQRPAMGQTPAPACELPKDRLAILTALKWSAISRILDSHRVKISGHHDEHSKEVRREIGEIKEAVARFMHPPSQSTLLDKQSSNPDLLDKPAAPAHGNAELSDDDVLRHMSKYWEHQWHDGDQQQVRISREQLAVGIRALLHSTANADVRKDSANEMSDEFETLINTYWNLAILEGQNGVRRNGVNETLHKLRAILSQSVEAHKNAARYKHLRDTHSWSPIIWHAIDFVGPDEDYGKALDDAVDAAITTQAKEQGL